MINNPRVLEARLQKLEATQDSWHREERMLSSAIYEVGVRIMDRHIKQGEREQGDSGLGLLSRSNENFARGKNSDAAVARLFPADASASNFGSSWFFRLIDILRHTMFLCRLCITSLFCSPEGNFRRMHTWEVVCIQIVDHTKRDATYARMCICLTLKFSRKRIPISICFKLKLNLLSANHCSCERKAEHAKIVVYVLN